MEAEEDSPITTYAERSSAVVRRRADGGRGDRRLGVDAEREGRDGEDLEDGVHLAVWVLRDVEKGKAEGVFTDERESERFVLVKM